MLQGEVYILITENHDSEPVIAVQLPWESKMNNSNKKVKKKGNMTTPKHCFWLVAFSRWGKGHTRSSCSKGSQAGRKAWTEPRYYVSFVFYVNKELWDRIGVMRHPTVNTAGQWAAGFFSASPEVAHPLWETWLKRLKWGQSLLFPHSLVLPRNSLSYFSCISNREGEYPLIAWTWEVRKGLDASSLHNTLGTFVNPTRLALFHQPMCHRPCC